MKKNITFLLFMISCSMFSQSELETYLKNPLEDVFLVSSNKDTVTINGYINDSKTSTSKTITLERGEILGVWSFTYRPSISLLTIPYKVRRKANDTPVIANSGLTNVGLNFAILTERLDRYFSEGKKSSHSLSLGLFMAPNVEELTPANTNNEITVNNKQLFFSTGLTLKYAYNNIELSFIPVGFDIATNSLGKKWIYNKNSWFGFGIGIDPKIFSPTINK